MRPHQLLTWKLEKLWVLRVFVLQLLPPWVETCSGENTGSCLSNQTPRHYPSQENTTLHTHYILSHFTLTTLHIIPITPTTLTLTQGVLDLLGESANEKWTSSSTRKDVLLM